MSRQTLAQGSAFLTANRVWDAILGYALNLILARQLGPELFGLFGVIITILLWLELVVRQTMPQYVARAVAEIEQPTALPRLYIFWQLGIGILLAVAFIVAAPAIAGVLNEPDNVGLFQLAALDIPLIAFYAIFLAVLSGRQMYWQVSAVLSAYSLSKLVITLTLLYLGFAVTGAILGSMIASVVGIVMVIVTLRHYFQGQRLIGDSEIKAKPKTAVMGGGAQAVFVLLRALLLVVPLWLVKAELPAAQAGYFQAALLVAMIPFALSEGITWALYVAFSRARAAGNIELCNHYLWQATRVMLIAAVLWVAVTIPTSETLLTFIFSTEYAQAAWIFAALGFGLAFVSIATTIGPVLLVRGYNKSVLGLAGGIIILEVILSLVLMKTYGSVGAAIGASVAGATAAGIALVYARNYMPRLIRQVLQIVLPGIIVAAVTAAIPLWTGAQLLAAYPLMTVLYVGLLFVTGALSKKDVETIRTNLLGRQREAEDMT